MFLKLGLFTSIAVTIGVLLGTVANADTLQACMETKAAALGTVTTEKVRERQGCTTEGTDFIVSNYQYQGRKQHTCDDDVCWTAPPGRIITDASATDVSASGDEHTIGAPRYSPDKELATTVCVHVHAKSKEQSKGSRGWQKIDLIATTKHLPAQEEMITIAAECVKEGAK